MRRVWGLLALVLAGCGVDPLPEPPSGPELVGEFHGEECTVCDGQARIAGGPGSVKDADTIWGVDLDSTAPPSVAPVQPDGSFELFIGAIAGDEVRLQARQGDERSEPVDLVMATDGVLDTAPRPLADCFVLVMERGFPDTPVGGTSPATLRVEHTCAAPVQVDSIALRAASPDFAVAAPPTPIVLGSGDFVDVAVDFQPSATGLREEVLLVEVSSPGIDRRAVTLFGNGAP